MPQISVLLILLLLTSSRSAFSDAETVHLDTHSHADHDHSDEEVDPSFQEWLRCTEPGAENCAPCEEDDHQLASINSVIGVHCLPRPSERSVVFNPELSTELQRERDASICACYTAVPQRATANEYNIYASGITNQPGVTPRVPETNNLQIELNETTISERIQAGLSAASYRSSTDKAIELGTTYSVPPQIAALNSAAQGATGANNATKWMTSGGGILATAGEAVGAASSTLHSIMSIARTAAQRYEFRPQDFNGPEREGYCIPYRHFLASKQFPESPEFYREFQGPGGTYRPDEWNYLRLTEEFVRRRGNRGMEEVENDPSMKGLMAKLEFLHNNPVLKNIFLSPGQLEVKNQLFNIIKDIPAPSCRTAYDCSRDTAWMSRMRSFRDQVADFLTDNEPATTAAHEGFEISLLLSQKLAALRSERASLTSYRIHGMQAATDPSLWASFCRIRDGQAHPNLISAGELADHFGERNFFHPEEDAEYTKYNEYACQSRRRDGEGNELTFADFLRNTCSGTNASLTKCLPDNRTELVAEYLQSTNDMNNPDGNNVARSLFPVLQRGSGIAAVRSEDVTNFNRLSRDPVLAERNIRSNTLASTATQRSASVSGAELQSSNLTGPSAMGLPPAEQIVIPQTPPRAPEVVRTELTQGEEEARQIREQISSLRNVIQREPASSDGRPSDALRSLTERLASLERRLEAKEQENEQLRNEIASSNSEQVNAPQRRADSQVSGNSERSQNNSPQVSQAPQGGVSGGAANAPVMAGGNAALSPSIMNSRSPRGATTAGNAALLSKYGLRDSGSQAGITVATSSDGINYQELRTQSQNSIIPISVSPEEFDRIKNNNQEALSRYLDQVRAMPGEVVRLSLTAGENRSLELFVVKDGEQISLVQAEGVGRRIASDSPVEVAPARETTLEQLQSELAQ